ncbi:hypothetical protein SAMN04487902_101338 [Prevotella sp. ne3005]|nr:hypothetical protein SAMN04487902_101338 [Prevotella sp. ne3005]
MSVFGVLALKKPFRAVFLDEPSDKAERSTSLEMTKRVCLPDTLLLSYLRFFVFSTECNEWRDLMRFLDFARNDKGRLHSR